jgi:autophagy-related protein 9
MSYPFASRYIEQFPKVKMVQFFRFVAFVASAIVSVLALGTLFDPELFLGFEITSERTVLFYLGVFGSIWAVSHGAIPEENMVFNPEYALRNVIEYTHYMPTQWKDRLHSDEVKREFSELYQMKVVIFLEEILSIIFTPLVLWFSLPQCSDRIIDFFREFTIHVDGLGYVCSFAVFDFKKGPRDLLQQGNSGRDGLRDDYYSTKHGKMAASYYGFIDNYVTNPKTGIPGHIPPGIRPQFHPPPTFPGLMSPTLAADMATSRMGRSERPRSRAPTGAGPASTRTPRFPPSAAHASPMPSMLLDPHHQPSASGFGGGRSAHNRRNSRSRYLPSENIIEDPIEDEEEEGRGDARPSLTRESTGPDSGGLGESKWETSPTRTSFKAAEETDESVSGNAGGVLGLLYQFQQKAQSDGRVPAVHI